MVGHEAQLRLVQSVVIPGQKGLVVEACVEGNTCGKEILFQPKPKELGVWTQESVYRQMVTQCRTFRVCLIRLDEGVRLGIGSQCELFFLLLIFCIECKDT